MSANPSNPWPLNEFFDPETDEVYQPGEYEDPHGVDLIGVDEEGLWWGTERAAYRLELSPFIVCVSGHSKGGVHFMAWFCGSDEAAIDFAERRWGKVTHVESGDTGMWNLTDEELRRIPYAGGLPSTCRPDHRPGRR